MRAYLDASAIVKLVCREPETRALVQYLDGLTDACTSAISEVEAARALRRLGFAADEASAVLDGLVVIGVDGAIRARASTLLPLTLRSSDAIHLATALEVGAAGLQFVTYDDRLAPSARTHGFTVVQPGRG